MNERSKSKDITTSLTNSSDSNDLVFTANKNNENDNGNGPVEDKRKPKYHSKNCRDYDQNLRWTMNENKPENYCDPDYCSGARIDLLDDTVLCNHEIPVEEDGFYGNGRVF